VLKYGCRRAARPFWPFAARLFFKRQKNGFIPLFVRFRLKIITARPNKQTFAKAFSANTVTMNNARQIKLSAKKRLMRKTIYLATLQ
jgi:ribosomal protein L15E